jgi:hypothetical protein
MATAKLDIGRELSAVDYKNYDFYKNLTADEKKAFNPFILMNFTSNTDSRDRDIQEWFIESTNEYVNKNYVPISKHKELLWKLYAATGAGVKTGHQYLAAKKDTGFNKIETLIAEIYPAMKYDEIKLTASLMDKNDVKELLDKMGFDKKQRKQYE